MTEQKTQVSEQLAKYVSALVNGTHEIASVTIRPKREWVGLTDEERNTIYANAGTGREAMKVVEAKLREKNT